MFEHDDPGFIERIAAPLRAAEALEPAFEARVLAAVRSAEARGAAPAWRRARRARPWQRLTAGRLLTVSPLGALAAAAVAGVLLYAARPSALGPRLRAEPHPPGFGGHPPRADGPTGLVEGRGPKAQSPVRFVLAAPGASTVALVGDFNGWDRAATPLGDADADGVWTVTVPLGEGSYHYAFIVDGTTWIGDPAAVTLGDEFGAPSSLISVPGGST